MTTRRVVLASLPVLALLALGPFVLTRDLVTTLFFTFVFLTLAANYDLLGGFLRYLNLGQAAYFGLGAYVALVLLTRLATTGIPAPLVVAASVVVAAVVTAVFAALVSYPLFRVRGAYFAVITFGVVLVLQQAVLNTPQISGGSYGVTVPRDFYLDLTPAYEGGLVVAWAAVVLNVLVSRSRLGLAFHAIRDSEEAAAAIGIDPFRYKRLALVIASVPSALVGCLFALFAGHIYVETVFGLDKTLLPVVMAMLGGSGTLPGPLLGTLIVQGIDLALRVVELPVPAFAVFGVLLMLIGLFLPGGIVSVVGERFLAYAPPPMEDDGAPAAVSRAPEG